MEEILRAGLMALNLMGGLDNFPYEDNRPANYATARMAVACAQLAEHARRHPRKHADELAYQCGLFKDNDYLRTLSDIKTMKIEIGKILD